MILKIRSLAQYEVKQKIVRKLVRLLSWRNRPQQMLWMKYSWAQALTLNGSIKGFFLQNVLGMWTSLT